MSDRKRVGIRILILATALTGCGSGARHSADPRDSTGRAELHHAQHSLRSASPQTFDPRAHVTGGVNNSTSPSKGSLIVERAVVPRPGVYEYTADANDGQGHRVTAAYTLDVVRLSDGQIEERLVSRGAEADDYLQVRRDGVYEVSHESPSKNRCTWEPSRLLVPAAVRIGSEWGSTSRCRSSASTSTEPDAGAERTSYQVLSIRQSMLLGKADVLLDLSKTVTEVGQAGSGVVNQSNANNCTTAITMSASLGIMTHERESCGKSVIERQLEAITQR